MKIKYKNAFSLTEVLIVLVIVAVLFAAVTPIVTRRAKSDLVSMDSVWRFIDSDPERGSFFDTGVNNWASSLYVGAAGGNADDEAKLVINTPNRSSQNHIQFRYSSDAATRGNGVASGSIALRGGNIFFGSDFVNALNNGNIENNTIAGLNILDGNNLNSRALKNATIIGNHAANNSSLGTPHSSGSMQNIFVGANAGAGAAGLNNNSIGNIYIGESAGAGVADAPNTTLPENVNHNIAIGYKAMGYNSYGQRNVFIGAGVGNSFTIGYNNTVAGSLFTGTGYNNTIIGYGTYHKNANRSNMTAIGYGACNAIGEGEGRITCIGYNSGSVSTVDNSFPSEASGQHIYLGGPSQGFGGRSPLEIHHNGTVATPPTVVLNSNLAVRGRLIVVNTENELFRLNFKNNSMGKICSADTYSNNFMSKYNGYYCNSITNVKQYSGLSTGTSCSGGYEGLGGCATITSDERLKENIVLNNDGLEQVLNLVPYNYTYKSDKTKQPQVGVIAQDLQKVFPISVSKGDDGFLRIRWDEMFYGIINAIKTLGAKIETLASEILNLEKDTKTISNSQKSNHKKIAELNKRLNNIEKRSDK